MIIIFGTVWDDFEEFDGTMGIFKLIEFLATRSESYRSFGDGYSYAKSISIDDAINEYLEEDASLPTSGYVYVINTKEETIERTKYNIEVVEKDIKSVEITKKITIGEVKKDIIAEDE